jgi:hypothetical protein
VEKEILGRASERGEVVESEGCEVGTRHSHLFPVDRIVAHVAESR